MGQQYDLVVIGGGPGGYPSALAAAELGKRTALIEKRDLGGTCLNRGCIPAKTLLHTSGLYREIRESGRFGIHCGEATVDEAALWSYKEKTVRELREGIVKTLEKQKVEIFCGSGEIVKPGMVKVTDRDGAEIVLEAANILIATGSRPAVPPIPGSDLAGVITSDYVLDGNRLGAEPGEKYQRLLIIGGGVIGMEMATAYSDLGSQVTVVEAMDRILPGMDREIGQNLKMILKKRGVEIHTSAMVKEITLSAKAPDALLCRWEEKGSIQETEADGILISTGRKPDMDGLFSEEVKAQIRMEHGYLTVDARGQTTVAEIYAAGDVTGGIQLAHVATAEGRRAVECMFGYPCSQKLDVIPSCVYTDPEIACVGMRLDEAKTAGIEAVAGKYIMSVNGKSVLTGQERGFIRLVAEKSTGKLLGAQMMCARATDMIGELGLAIGKGLTVADLAASVMAHPTFSEGIGEAAAAMLK